MDIGWVLDQKKKKKFIFLICVEVREQNSSIAIGRKSTAFHDSMRVRLGSVEYGTAIHHADQGPAEGKR